jgi:hypothetical protein
MEANMYKYLTYQSPATLARIALEDDRYHIREAATRLISDAGTLERIARLDPNANVRSAASAALARMSR